MSHPQSCSRLFTIAPGRLFLRFLVRLCRCPWSFVLSTFHSSMLRVVLSSIVQSVVSSASPRPPGRARGHQHHVVAPARAPCRARARASASSARVSPSSLALRSPRCRALIATPRRTLVRRPRGGRACAGLDSFARASAARPSEKVNIPVPFPNGNSSIQTGLAYIYVCGFHCGMWGS